MNLLLTIAVIMAAIAALLIFFRKSASTSSAAKEYRARNSLLTAAERSFFGVLDEVVPEDLLIMCKTRLLDIIQPERCDKRQWHQRKARIIQKHVDFLLVDGNTLKPMLAIELNDRSHADGARQERDRFLRKALDDAGIPLLFFQAKRSYIPDEIGAPILKALGRNSAPEKPAAKKPKTLTLNKPLTKSQRVNVRRAIKIEKPDNAPASQ